MLGRSEGDRHSRKTWSRLVRLVTVAWLCTYLPQPVSAQFDAGRALINEAADSLNMVTPQGLPEQTILVGFFDGAANEFNWAIPLKYPAEIPEFKWDINGGFVKPRAVAQLNSYHVTYKVAVSNTPPSFSLVLSVPDANGGYSQVEGTLNEAGDTMMVSFEVHDQRSQRLRFSPDGGADEFRVWPSLSEQLGAFVVPHLLVAIVYEPPGASSSASYERESTTGTVMSFDWARSSGIVETKDPDWMFDLFLQVGTMALSWTTGDPGEARLLEGSGSVLTIVADLREKTEVRTTIENTRAVSGEVGTFISVSDKFSTILHEYPGGGDLFVVMYDVLFMYVVTKGRVYLAPMAFSGVRMFSEPELRAALPADIADGFVKLNPHFNPLLRSPATQPKTDARYISVETSSLLPSRFQYHMTAVCETSGLYTHEVAKKEFRATASSQGRSQVRVIKVTGLAASINSLTGGSNETVASTTYFASMEEYESDETVASITLGCADGNGPYEVLVYFDRLYRTFFSVRGQPLADEAPIAGVLRDATGRPLAGEEILLEYGDQVYSVITDAQGNYRFPFQSLSAGSGWVMVGERAWPVVYEGSPLQDFQLRIPERLRPIIRRRFPGETDNP